jgi:peptide/nickel transport system ATP-binding protein
MTALLSVKNLTLSTTLDKKLLVDNVNFEILGGESVGIVGESGSGKTLTALSILGLLPKGVSQDSGEIIFQGKEISQADKAALQDVRGNRISMIYQDPMTSLNPMMKIGRQIQEAARAHNANDDEAKVLKALHDVGIPSPESCFSSYPHEFSGGMRQRVMIAMSLLLRPNLLIADEPTTALDVTIQRQILNLVDEQRRNNAMSLLWISHDLSVVAELVDKVIVMYAGRIAEIGSVQEIFENPKHPYTAGLIGSLVKRKHQQKLISIPGNPPKPWTVANQCGFADRCANVTQECRTSKPELLGEGNRSFACFNPMKGVIS